MDCDKSKKRADGSFVVDLSSGHRLLTGITAFNFDPDALPENSFLNYLGTIDLHHGPYSSETPYTALEVIGARLAIDVREGLGELGFDEFVEHPDGFSARRSTEEDAKVRD